MTIQYKINYRQITILYDLINQEMEKIRKKWLNKEEIAKKTQEEIEEIYKNDNRTVDIWYIIKQLYDSTEVKEEGILSLTYGEYRKINNLLYRGKSKYPKEEINEMIGMFTKR